MALASNRKLKLKGSAGKRAHATILTGQVIYKGALVVAPAAGTTVKVAANETTTLFRGVAENGPLTGDGTKICEYSYDEIRLLPSTGLTAGNIGAQVYCLDDEKVCAAATFGPTCGQMVALESADLSWIWLRSGLVEANAS